MPAAALTDHGVLYGALDWLQGVHGAWREADHRRRGLLLPPTASRPARQASVPSAPAGAGTRPATATCSGSPAWPAWRASTTSRASTATCWPTTTRAVASAALPRRRGAAAIHGRATRRARAKRSASSATCSGVNLFLEMLDHGLPESADASTAACRGCTQEFGHAAGRHQRRPLRRRRRRPTPRTCCSASRPTAPSTTRSACGWTPTSSICKRPDEMARALRRLPGGAANTLRDRRALRPAISSFDRLPSAALAHPRRARPARATWSTSAGSGCRAAMPRAMTEAVERRLRLRAGRHRTRLASPPTSCSCGTSSALRASAASCAGRAARPPAAWSLYCAGHHRPRPARARPDLRALPEPRRSRDARHRHGLPGRPARRGHPLRHPSATATITWRRSSPSGRCGAGGDARRRPRARHALQRGRSRRQAGPELRSDITIDRAISDSPSSRRSTTPTPQLKRADRHRAHARGRRAPRLDPRRGRRHLARAADRPCAAQRAAQE